MEGFRAIVRKRASRRAGAVRLPSGAALLSLVLLAVFTAGCRLVAVADPPSPAPPVPSTGPAIEAGATDADADRATAALLAEAESLLAAGRAEEARARALEIEERYPTAASSAFALLIRARASFELADWVEADEASARYLDVVSPDGPLLAEAILLRARARWEGGLEGGIEGLFALPPDADPAVLDDAEETATEWASDLDTSVLRDLVSEAPDHPRILPPFLVELAFRRDVAGARSEAEELAERALSLSPGPSVADRARIVVEGRTAEELETASVIGAILPDAGPPSLLQLAREIEEGIELALALEERESRLPVRFVRVGDGSGDQSDMIRAVQELERAGVAAAVGPLSDPLVGPAARARSGLLPILSPTARTVPVGEAGVYSLTAADPEAGRALGRLVLAQEAWEVTLVHSTATEATLEAQWFREAYEAGGGVIRRTLSYPQGATSFAWPLAQIATEAEVGRLLELREAEREAEDEEEEEQALAELEEFLEQMEPVVLVIIAPADELQLLVPQLVFYNVRDIPELTIFGGEAWTSDAILQGIQERHTDGVYTVTTRTPDGGYGPGWTEFVEAYEDHFQRTLRSPVPALGYDAARLLIRGTRASGGDARRALEALEEIGDHPGATGLLSVVDGRIQRVYSPVRLEGRATVPLTP